MKIKFILLSVLIFATTIATIAQNNKDFSQNLNEEIPYYYENGIKMSSKNKVPLLFSGINDIVNGETPEKKAMDWISNHQRILKIDNLSDLKVRFQRNSLSGQTVRFQQFLNNIPVYHSEITVHIAPNNKVTYVDNTYDASVLKIKTSPSLSKEDAFQLAKEKIKASEKIAYSENHLFIFNPSNAIKTKLVYKVIIESDFPIGSWEIMVDAQTGKIIRAVDKAYYNKKKKQGSNQKTPVNGIGNVFDPDPLSYTGSSYGGNYSDNSDATNAQLDAATVSVTLLDIDLTTGTYKLSGPYAEVQDFESPSKGLFTQSTNDFSFNRSDDAFEAVNCYYMIDKSMRYINETLGIPLIPYQYSTGVRYDPSGLSGADNSHYMPGSGRLAFGEGGVDDAEDADVIIHELGHGVHDWLTGGSASSSQGLGEGSGDYWGQSYSRSLGQWTSSDPEYQWFFSWDGHNTFWNGRITNYTASYPGGLTGAIHTDGQIWATALMRIYDIIGREKTDKAFLEGLAMTGSSSNQQSAAIAVRQAAIDMGYSCPDIDVFTTEFTATGYNLPALNLSQFPPVISDVVECVSGIPADIIGNGNSLNWYDDPALTNLLQTGDTLNTGETTPGTYTYYVKYSNPACSVAPADTVTLIINNLPNVTASIDTALCIGDTAIINVTGNASSYSWDNGLGSNQSYSVYPNFTTLYSVTGIDGNGCSNSDSVLISVNSLPIIIASSTDITICQGSQITLTGSGGSSYLWDNGVVDGNSFTPSNTTTYTVTGTDGNSCKNTDQITIVVNPLPTINISGNNTLCDGDSTTLTASGGTYYVWNTSDTTDIINVTPLSTTIYDVTGYDSNGCSNSSQITVTINSLPIITASSDTTICQGDTVIINASGAINYSWDNGFSGQSQLVIPDSTTTYIVTGLDINGCTNNDSVIVNVNICTSVNNITAGNLQVYPVPASDLIHVNMDSFVLGTSIQLFDDLGRLVFQMTPKSRKSIINLSNFSKGIYTLSLNTGREIIIQKIIKE